jgi:hypothetical protein
MDRHQIKIELENQVKSLKGYKSNPEIIYHQAKLKENNGNISLPYRVTTSGNNDVPDQNLTTIPS